MNGAATGVKALGYRPSVGDDEIERQRRVWANKPQVRTIYERQVFPRILRELPASGVILEIGSGAGSFKSWLPRVKATDVVANPWLDVRCDALRLPCRSGSVAALVAINVMHHLPSIGPFLEEAARALAPGGRCVCVEPWITPVSRLFYRWFHHEPCHPVDDPLYGDNSSPDAPMEGNTYLTYQAMPAVEARFPALRVAKVERFCALAWPISMGFREGTLLPDALLRLVVSVEEATGPVWRRWAALNALVVLERAHGRRAMDRHTS